MLCGRPPRHRDSHAPCQILGWSQSALVFQSGRLATLRRSPVGLCRSGRSALGTARRSAEERTFAHERNSGQGVVRAPAAAAMRQGISQPTNCFLSQSRSACRSSSEPCRHGGGHERSPLDTPDCRRCPAYWPGRPATPRPDLRRPIAVRYQLVINCVGHPEPLDRFWAEALGCVLEPPPAGFATWDDWRRGVGLPESWLGRGTDCIIDPDGAGPRIWIQVVPDRKTVSNRLHLDIHASGGLDLPIETRKKRIDAEALRLCDLGATLLSDLSEVLGKALTTRRSR